VLILIALLVVPFFCATSYVREFIAVDSALDSGASYDYIAGRADHTANHPVIPFSHRHRTLLVSSGLLFAGAVVLRVFHHVREVANPSDLTSRCSQPLAGAMTSLNL
jgi:uncharacterized UPF0160 family protein